MKDTPIPAKKEWKVGDKFIVRRSYDKLEDRSRDLAWVPEMDKLVGRELTVVYVGDSYVEADGYAFLKSWIETVDEWKEGDYFVYEKVDPLDHPTWYNPDMDSLSGYAMPVTRVSGGNVVVPRDWKDPGLSWWYRTTAIRRATPDDPVLPGAPEVYYLPKQPTTKQSTLTEQEVARAERIEQPTTPTQEPMSQEEINKLALTNPFYATIALEPKAYTVRVQLESGAVATALTRVGTLKVGDYAILTREAAYPKLYDVTKNRVTPTVGEVIEICKHGSFLEPDKKAYYWVSAKVDTKKLHDLNVETAELQDKLTEAARKTSRQELTEHFKEAGVSLV